jgi:hypothetical protein
MYYNRDWLYRRHSLKNKKNLMSQISLFWYTKGSLKVTVI